VPAGRVARTFHADGDPTLRSLPAEFWGFAGLLPQLVDEALQIADPVSATAHVLGLAGRVSPQVAVAAMPRRERALWRHASAAAPAPQRVGAAWATSDVRVCRDGRVRLGEPVAARPGAANASERFDWLAIEEEAMSIAQLELDRASWAAWCDEDDELRACDRFDDACLWAWQSQLRADASRLPQLLAHVNANLQHAAPLIWYVDASRFSNFVDENLAGKSLLPAAPRNVFRPQELDELLARPVEERFALLAADLLDRAGGPHRWEERNWTQVRPADLRLHLTTALASYARLDGGARSPDPQHEDPWAMLVDLAEQAHERRDRLAQRRQRYRSIAAPLLHKREAFVHPGCAQEARQRFEQAWLRVTRHAVGPRPRGVEDLAGYFDAVAATAGACGRFASALEEALALTAFAALRAADADVAMTRGHRRPAEIARDVDDCAWDRLAAREQGEFYCCVLPHPRVLLGAERARLAESLWAMAARMQYNSWHFLGGNLPTVGDVRGRDRFIPPRLPDVSAWSDQHHRGHIATGVRYSVRAPAPVTVAGRDLWGFCDVRLLRFVGCPFDETEMMIGLTAARHAASLTQAALDHAARSGSAPHVEAFGRPFYVSGQFADVVEDLRL
jgi:hypothetical protein